MPSRQTLARDILAIWVDSPRRNDWHKLPAGTEIKDVQRLKGVLRGVYGFFANGRKYETIQEPEIAADGNSRQD